MKRRWQRVGVALATALLPIVACAATGPPEPGARPWALEGQLVFQHLAELETMAVGAIAQDPQGFLWFGTQTTLLRWDGVRLRSYARNPEASGSLADNFIRSLLVDESGRIWVGSNSGG